MATIAEFPTVDEVSQSLPPTSVQTPKLIWANEPVPAPESKLPKLADTAVVVPVGTGSTASKGVTGINMTLKEDKIYLSGRDTRNFSAKLKKLNGSWDKANKYWVFDNSNQADVNTFLEGVKSGQIKPEPFVGGFNKKPYPYPPNKHHTVVNGGQVQQSNSQHPIIPVYNASGYTSQMRTVGPWNVFVPNVGMVAKIRVGEFVVDRKVTSVDGDATKGYVAMVVDDATGDQSRLEVTNGHWGVRGMMPQHSIRFGAN